MARIVPRLLGCFPPQSHVLHTSRLTKSISPGIIPSSHHSNTLKSSPLVFQFAPLSSSTSPTNYGIIAANANHHGQSTIAFLGMAGLIAVMNHENNQPSECAADDRSMVEKVKDYWESNKPIVPRPKSLTEIEQDVAENFQKKAQLFIDSGTGGQISWGFGMGFCSGYAARKFSKFGAVICGSAFMLMQCASYTGYLKVNYKKMERDISDFFDLNEVSATIH